MIKTFELTGTYTTAKGAAELLSVNDSRIRQLLLSGRIVGAIHIGRDWLIPIVDGQIQVEKRECK